MFVIGLNSEISKEDWRKGRIGWEKNWDDVLVVRFDLGINH